MEKRHRIIFLVYLFTVQFLTWASGQNSNGIPRINKVVIDAGHGGFDYGALGSVSKEKDITLAIALKAGKLITENFNDVEVIFTRNDDKFVELHKRAQFANDSKADLFISIHCNSINSPDPAGAETYVMGIHKTTENLDVAKSENSAILMENDYNLQYDGFNPNLDEDYIVLNMAQSAGLSQSIDFSAKIQAKLYEIAGIRNRGVKQAGFLVLYRTTMPGVLIETGFISNPEEEKFLMDVNNQGKIAQAISEAFGEYKKQYEWQPVSLLEFHNDETTDTTQSKPTITYRIWFASFKKFQPVDGEQFKVLNNVKVYYDEGKYHYACEIAYSPDEINQKLADLKKMKRIKKRYLKNLRVVAFNEDNTIVAFPQ